MMICMTMCLWASKNMDKSRFHDKQTRALGVMRKNQTLSTNRFNHQMKNIILLGYAIAFYSKNCNVVLDFTGLPS